VFVDVVAYNDEAGNRSMEAALREGALVFFRSELVKTPNKRCHQGGNVCQHIAVLQVLWLLERQRYRQAMHAAIAAPYVRPSTWAKCCPIYLEHLVSSGQFSGAQPQLIA
jgi:hypothetical protein